MGQKFRAFHLDFLLINIVCQRELRQFRAVGYCAVGIGRDVIGRAGQILPLLAVEHQFRFERQTAQLAQSHARERQSVAHFRQCHLSLVQFHAHRQFVGLRGHAFGYHLHKVAVEACQHVAVTLGERLLVFQRNDLPVRLVHAQQERLLFRVELLAGQLFREARDAVVRLDFAAHIERLLEDNRAHGEVARVGVERVYESLAETVAKGTRLPEIRPHVLRQRREFGMLREDLTRHLLHLPAHGRAERGKFCLLVVAEEREFVARAHVCGRNVNFRQIVCKCRLALIVRLVDVGAGCGNGAVVAQRHRAATVQRERLAGECGEALAAKKECNAEFFHFP